MKKVLYLSYDGMTDPLGQSQVIPYLQGLTKQGYFFTVVSFEKPERFREHQDQLSQLLQSSGIAWVPLLYHKKPPVLSTLYDVYALRKKAYELHREHNFRLVHCRSYITALIGMAMKRAFGIKFIFDMRGFWADERIEGGLWNLKNPVYKIIYQYFKKKEKQLLSAADYTVTLTHKAKDIIHQWGGISNQPVPIQVISCCVDTELFDLSKIDESAKQTLRKKLNIPPNSFILSYLGSLGTWYMVEEMLVYFNVLQQNHPDAYFLFITKDSPEEIHHYCKKLSIDRAKIVVATATRPKVPLYLSVSSWSIFFIKPVFSKQASSATKMGEIMSMGIPFVTNRGWGDVEEIVHSEECGLLVDDLTEEGFEKTINSLLKVNENPSLLRETAAKHYDLFTGINKYKEVYDHMK